MSDSSQTVSVFDGRTATTVVCQDSERAIDRDERCILQFRSLMSTAISHCADEAKGLDHRLCEALNQFGLNSLKIEIYVNFVREIKNLQKHRSKWIAIAIRVDDAETCARATFADSNSCDWKLRIKWSAMATGAIDPETFRKAIIASFEIQPTRN
jgi:hypothetical protein